MRISFFIKRTACIFFVFFMGFLLTAPVFAQEFPNDIFVGPGDVRVPGNILKGDLVKIYVTVHNTSVYDLSGVVKLYAEKTQSYIGSDQPVSILAGKTDDVFIEWEADTVGEYPIAVRVLPWKTEGDNPDNNKIVTNLYVDIDSDQDGTGNRLDADDDNDSVPDNEDDFPLDSNESKDTDKDGTGDNADTDDDGDGVSDIEDDFPLDPNESKDTDKDGTGDHTDVFPYDPAEWLDSDGDGMGDNVDPNNQNHGPIPTIYVPSTHARAGKTLTFNSLKSSDPDGQVVKHEWDFGDGTLETGVIIDHVFDKQGDMIVTLKVTDDKGESREQQIQITVGWNALLIALIATTILLILLLLGLFIPGSRFYHKKVFVGLRRQEAKKKPIRSK